MQLSAKAMALTIALLWGGSVLLVGLMNLASPTYGIYFLSLTSSIYPGFHVSRTVGDVLVGTSYAVVDGGIGGFLFGWLYNVFAG